MSRRSSSSRAAASSAFVTSGQDPLHDCISDCQKFQHIVSRVLKSCTEVTVDIAVSVFFESIHVAHAWDAIIMLVLVMHSIREESFKEKSHFHEYIHMYLLAH